MLHSLQYFELQFSQKDQNRKQNHCQKRPTVKYFNLLAKKVIIDKNKEKTEWK